MSLTVVSRDTSSFATMSIRTAPQNVLDTEPISNGVRSSAPMPAYRVAVAVEVGEGDPIEPAQVRLRPRQQGGVSAAAGCRAHRMRPDQGQESRRAQTRPRGQQRPPGNLRRRG